MRFYNQPHRFYCGVDLHARTIALHVLDEQGRTVLARGINAQPELFLNAIGPFRDGLVVGCECMFAGPRRPNAQDRNVPDAEVSRASIPIRDTQKLEKISSRSRCAY
jgi:hypothetical protein